MEQQYESMPSRQSKANYKKGKHKKKRPFFRFFIILISSLLILAGAAAVYLYYKSSEAIGQISLPKDQTEVDPAQSVKKKPVAIALLGIDARPKGVKGGGMNTDVMMVASFNPATKKAVVVSLPRDSKIAVEGYKQRKVNGYYAAFYSNARSNKKEKEDAELEAMAKIREELGKFFGIDIRYTATIDFQGFVDVVDALGGVDVDVDMRMKYKDTYDGTDIDLMPGRQPLSGQKALDFVRYRQSNDGSNMSTDFARNKRQGQVLGAMFDQLMTIGGIMKIGSLFDAVGNNMKMDMPESEIKNMITAYYNISRSDIEFITIDGTWKSPYVYLKDDSLKAARNAIQENMAE